MEENKIQKEMNPIQYFDKTINDMELKIKDIYVNKIRIKENLNSIKRIENKNNFLDDMILDKKSELNILKNLLILKEQKKLNFEDIISKYLYQLILIDNKNNNKIDILKKKNLIINRKQKIINMLLDNLNNNLNNYLKNDKKENLENKLIPKNNDELLLNEKIKNKNFYNQNSDKKYFYSNGINKYINKEPVSYKAYNKKNNISNGDKDKNKYNVNKKNELEKMQLKKEEIKEYINDFQNYINKEKLKENNNNNNNNNNNQLKINNYLEENNNNKINNKNDKEDNKEDDNILVNIKQKINNNNNNIYNNINNNINNINYNKRNDKIQNSIINFKPNKNLQKSRENLKYFILQNDKEKINKRKKENYFSFIKLLISKIKNYTIQLKKISFNQIKNYNNILKLKNLLNKYLQYNTNIIISNIKEIFQKTCLIYNENINEEIVNDNEFLTNLEINNNNNDNIDKIYDIKELKSNLNKIKRMNKEIMDIENNIKIFTNKLLENT